jgi:Leu/Phe-tRNA-protein transferase
MRRVLRFTESGHLFVEPGMDTDEIIDAMIRINYDEEFCIGFDFSPAFVAALMRSGFLVMSACYDDETNPIILLPKHHLVRNVLFFNDLHIGKTARRFLPKYELRPGSDYDAIVDSCVAKHGDDWLTKPLLDSMSCIRNDNLPDVCPYSFALYSRGKLVAGEFGVKAGRVYTSYSGYYDEDSSGRVQMIKTALYLRDNGFDFWDLGMPLDYKYTLGARDISLKEFVKLFRAARLAFNGQH